MVYLALEPVVPYKIPDDPTKLEEQGQQAKALWSKRDQRMANDQDALELRGLTPKEDQVSITLNDRAVTLFKGAAMVSSHPPPIEVASRMPEHDHVAQQMENMGSWWREEAEDRYMMGIRNPLCYDEVLMHLARGWIGSRLMRGTDPDFPWNYDLIDPICLYPFPAAGIPRYIVHQYWTTIGELYQEWGEDGYKALDNSSDEHDRVQVNALYTDTAYAATVQGRWLKKPTDHGYGFNPINISLASGAFYRSTPKRQSEYPEYVGTSFIYLINDMFEAKEDLAIMLKTQAARESKPPMAVFTEEPGNVKQANFNPGAVSTYGQKDRIEPLSTGLNMANFGPLLEMIQSGINAGSLGPAAYQDKPFTSGFDRSIAMGSARDLLYPFVRSLERYYKRVLWCMFKLATMHNQNIAYTMRSQQSGRMVMAELAPETVAEMLPNVRINVRFRDVLPQDKHTNASTAALLAREKILSLDTIRREFLDVQDTELENTRVLGDLIWMNPMLAQAGAISAAMRSSDPIVQMVAQQALQQMQMQMMQSQDPNAQPPQPGSGVPNSAVPDEVAGPNAGGAPNSSALGPPPSPGGALDLPI